MHCTRWKSVLFVCSLTLFWTACSGGETPFLSDSSTEASSASATADDGEMQTTQKDLWGGGHQGPPNDWVLRAKMRAHDATEPETTGPFDDDLVEFGQKLFFDKALSGPIGENADDANACAGCHHPKTATSDDIEMSVGVGFVGPVGDRFRGPGFSFEPRNSTDLFNLGLKGWKTQFREGRVQEMPNGNLEHPFGDTPPGLDLVNDPDEKHDGVVGIQALGAPQDPLEMKGAADKFHNPVSNITNDDSAEIWKRLRDRILSISGYPQLAQDAFPDKDLSEIHFGHFARAIAAFQKDAFTFLDSPFDQYLKGDDSALSDKEKKGADLFYGKAGCADCHSGTLTTDQEFHNIATPQIGPGKPPHKPLDPGRYLVTGQPKHKYAFRTEPLRNVELTPPYMHGGAYHSLREAVEHHLDAADSLRNYDGSQLRFDYEAQLHDSPETIDEVLSTLDPRMKIRARIQDKPWHPLRVSDKEVGQLVAFLKSMTSPTAENDLMATQPSSVPSGRLADGTAP